MLQTDKQTDRQTDTGGYRVAPQLQNVFNNVFASFVSQRIQKPGSFINYGFDRLKCSVFIRFIMLSFLYHLGVTQKSLFSLKVTESESIRSIRRGTIRFLIYLDSAGFIPIWFTPSSSSRA